MIDVSKLMNAKRVVVEKKTIIVTKEFVRSFRITHNLTQVALANILGVTKKAIEKWEQGKNPVCGSSALLLTLLSEDPALFSKVYSSRIVARDAKTDEYKPFYVHISKSIKNKAAISEPSFSSEYIAKGGNYCEQY